MKKKVAILIILIFVSVLAGIIYFVTYGMNKPTSYVVDGTDFSAEVINGRELILSLPSNATTGYSWVIVDEPDNFTSDYNTYIEDGGGEGRVGVGGNTQFRIVALSEGSGTMTFQYKRNWEGGEIEGTYELSLEIIKSNKDYLQIEAISFIRQEDKQ